MFHNNHNHHEDIIIKYNYLKQIFNVAIKCCAKTHPLVCRLVFENGLVD